MIINLFHHIGSTSGTICAPLHGGNDCTYRISAANISLALAYGAEASIFNINTRTYTLCTRDTAGMITSEQREPNTLRKRSCNVRAAVSKREGSRWRRETLIIR